ncbi:MAG TPA: hypothetical protein PKD86_06670 [Gemmatales bacterium]|nr:hypothetical protein [Gemmatales bacterium]HMP59020.1 hypothetical protein [Gemmatales bacterium]
MPEINRVRQVQVTDWSTEPTPAIEFTLSAFGLPEPYGIEWERPTPWWLYAAISGGLLLFVVVLVRLWRRQPRVA